MKNSDPRPVGIELGTTGTRCISFAGSGCRVSNAHADYPLMHLQAGWVEPPVPAMFDATARVCREAMAQPHVSVRPARSRRSSAQRP
jgi:sugar (pentulose or hexulose) kinase